MKYKPLLKILSILFFSNHAHAEGACPSGYYQTTPAGPAGPVGCAPIPEQIKPITWTDPWGAAANDETGVWGISADMPDKERAANSAIKECERRGGKDCKIAMTYNRQCLAIVASTSNYGISSAPNRENAIEAATNTCKKDSSGKECWIYYSGCSLPARKP